MTIYRVIFYYSPLFREFISSLGDSGGIYTPSLSYHSTMNVYEIRYHGLLHHLQHFNAPHGRIWKEIHDLVGQSKGRKRDAHCAYVSVKSGGPGRQRPGGDRFHGLACHSAYVFHRPPTSSYPHSLSRFKLGLLWLIN
jgi:hypothetical protein